MRYRPHPPELESLFSEAPSATTPMLLELVRRQAERRRPRDLLGQLERDGFVQPSRLDQRLVHQLDGLALGVAEGFEAVLLSPVAPLGSCSVLAPTSQDRTLSSTRGSEVVSDPTNVLALECARRLGRAPRVDVRLCTVHQVLRAQALPPEPGFSRHFRLFALAEAGPARGEDGFEVEAIERHLGVFDALFDALETEMGCRFPQRRAILHAAPGREVLARRAFERLRRRVEVEERGLDSRYYDGLRVLFGAESTSGRFVPMGDIGVFDWIARLTANRRQRFVASGLGIQLAPILFRTA